MKRIACFAMIVALTACDSATATDRQHGVAQVERPEVGASMNQGHLNGVTVLVADTVVSQGMSHPTVCVVPVQFFNAIGSVPFLATTATVTAGSVTSSATATSTTTRLEWGNSVPLGQWTTKELWVASPSGQTSFTADLRIRWESAALPGETDSVTVTTHCKR